MRSHFPRASMIAAAFGASAALLVGCGGSTVTSDDVASETTTASAEDTTTATETATTTDAEPTGSPEATGTTEADDATGTPAEPRPEGRSGAGVAPPPEDQGAREISEIPDPASTRSAEEDEFLDSLAEGGVDVSGLEGSLLGTASTVCASGQAGEVTANAVAGQLIEQGRTELTHEEATDLLVDTARTDYCP